MKFSVYIFLSVLLFTNSSCRFLGCNDVVCAPCPVVFGMPLLTFKTDGLNSFSQNQLDSITYKGPETERRLISYPSISSDDLNIDPTRGEEAGVDTGYVIIPNQDNLIIHSIKYRNVTPQGDGGCCGLCADYDFISVIINDSIYSKKQLPLLILNQ